jgi:phage tail sheath protein FI
MALTSAGVEIKEIDLTNVVPSLTTSLGGYAGSFNWGPAGELVTVSSEKDLITLFGAPNNTNPSQTASFFTAASFLKYGNSLKVSRSVEAGDLNAASSYLSSSTAYSTLSPYVQIKNKDGYDAIVTGNILKSAIVGRYAGSLGNALKVIICRASALASGGSGATARTDATLFSYVPGTSTYAANVKAVNSIANNMEDEIHVAVIDSDGSFTGTAGTVLEKYEGLSIFTDAKTENGATNYYREVINRASNYIYINKLNVSRITTGSTGVVETEFAVTDVTASSVATTALGAKATTGGVTITLTGGANVAMTPTGMADAYNLFADSQSVDIGLLFGEVHNTTATAVTNDAKLSAIVNARKDCVGFMSAPMSITTKSTDSDKYDEIAKATTGKINLAGCPVSSYMVMDSSPVYVYNKYNDNYLYIPACGHVAGLCANTDAVADAWFSPAGFNRGQLQDVVKLAYNPNQADRDALYTQGVNPISAFPGQGIVLYGDKTRLAKPSAFDRINVRRLFITLEKAIANASKFQLFEQNDEFTRAAFKNIVEPYLRDVQGRRGITDFRVVCDATNNTGQVIDGNRFVADIYIKPTRSINFITLNFVATRTGVEFKTIVGA